MSDIGALLAAPTEAIVQTVTGPIAASSLGTTLVHEHLWSDFTPLLAVHPSESSGRPLDGCQAAGSARWDPAAFPDNYVLQDIELQAEELALSRVRTVVDATPPSLGRSPIALQKLSRATGVQVVMGCGWYLDATHDPDVASSTIDDLAASLIAELTDGVADTGIRPGLIGEIGTGDPISNNELRCVRAAAVAAVETGVALTVHLHPWGVNGPKVIEVVAAEGLRLDRLLLNHVTTAVGDDSYLLGLLDTGANIAFDLFGFDHSLIGPGRYPPSDYDAVVQIGRLVDAGHSNAIFVSQDVGVRTRLCRYGGWGYGHLVEHVVPLMNGLGFDNALIGQLLATNPARLLQVGGSQAFQP